MGLLVLPKVWVAAGGGQWLVAEMGARGVTALIMVNVSTSGMPAVPTSDVLFGLL